MFYGSPKSLNGSRDGASTNLQATIYRWRKNVNTLRDKMSEKVTCLILILTYYIICCERPKSFV